MKKRQVNLWIALVVLVLAYLTFKAFELQRRKEAWRLLEKNIEREVRAFKGQAGIVIKDLSTGWEISINKDMPFRSASLVKIPIMASCFYAANEGALSLDEPLVLKAENKVSGSGRLKEAPAGTMINTQDLIGLMISESDNTACNLLIERVGFDYLNSNFKKLGLKSTNINRLMMDFESRKDGIENFTTPSDLAFLLEEIYAKRLIKRSYSRKCLDLLKDQKIRDRIPAGLPYGTTVAHKTGLENGVCHDAGIVFTPRGNFLAVILTRHTNKSAISAKLFIRRIASQVYGYYQYF